MQALEAASFMGIYRDCHSSRNKLSNIKNFIILQLGEGSKSFNKHRCANFSGENWDSEAFWDVCFLRILCKKKNKKKLWVKYHPWIWKSLFTWSAILKLSAVRKIAPVLIGNKINRWDGKVKLLHPLSNLHHSDAYWLWRDGTEIDRKP